MSLFYRKKEPIKQKGECYEITVSTNVDTKDILFIAARVFITTVLL